eukprot:Skav214596  [mRNA]  locus=scaffold57:520822:522899:+ [translate_table: standard]
MKVRCVRSKLCFTIQPPRKSRGQRDVTSLCRGRRGSLLRAQLSTPDITIWRKELRSFTQRRVRLQLRKRVRHTLGPRARRRLRVLAGELSLHHSWNFEELPVQVQRIIAMRWWCSACQIHNDGNSEYCSACHQHWNVVWKKKRSRSHHPKKEKKEKSRNDQEKADSKDVSKDNASSEPVWAVIPDKMPWVTSTPQTHLAHREVHTLAATPESNLPPPPVLPAPPAPTSKPPEASAMTPEENQALEHLRGLAKLGMTLPPAMEQQFLALQNKEKETAVEPSLTHTHLHKLARLKGQVVSAEQKILSLDEEWRNFVSTVTQKLQLHGQCYQQYRADLLENYNRKLEELNQLKHTVSQASQALVGQSVPSMPAMPVPDMNEDFTRIQQVAQAGTVDQIQEVQLVSDMEDEAEMEPVYPNHMPVQQEKIKAQKASTYRDLRPAAFGRNAGSPQKVQQAHLKQVKETKSRKEDKEDSPGGMQEEHQG